MKSQNKINSMTLVALITAITCVLAPLSIPIGPVPISLTNLVIYISVMLIGWKKATISYLIYLLIGLVGLPVFSAFTGGAGKLLGPTGGYLIGFIFMTIISGIFVEKFKNSKALWGVGMILGTIVTYAFGTSWLAYQANLSFANALAVGVIPFIIGDIIKIIIALIIGSIIKKRIIKSSDKNQIKGN